MIAQRAATLPLVYWCSGCSSAAQLANHLAVRLDREGEAEMSCIAGVGGGVRKLVRTAQSGRHILAIDGCVLGCAANCLRRAGVEPTVHVLLHERGVAKRYHADFEPQAAHQLLKEMRIEVRALAARAPQDSPRGRSVA
jgi:uncharacterized metal-binding protein